MLELPPTTCIEHTPTRVVLALTITPELSAFQGHFPDFPILPGVVQLGWVSHYAREWLILKNFSMKETQVKFTKPILPGTNLTLTIEYISIKNQIRFSFHSTTEVFASGKAIYEVES